MFHLVLHVFHLNVVYGALSIHICCKYIFQMFHLFQMYVTESLSLVLVINDTKLLMPCVKCFELGISNTCDEGVCGKEWWPQDHK
jgi:hypothetical protein